MPVNYNVSEIYDIGIEIEKNGRDFYNTAAELTEDQETKKFFSELASWENSHISIFTQFKAKLPVALSDESPFYDMENERSRYLKAAADTYIFRKNLNIPNIVKGCKGPVNILKLAIQFEKDSVVLFTTMTNFVPGELEKSGIVKLIDEELMHISYLQDKITLLNKNTD